MEEKVLLFSTEFPPTCGGAGRVAEQNAKILTDAGIKVDVLTRDAGDSGSTDFNIIKVKYVSKIFPLYFAKKLKEIKLSNYSLIILNDIGAALTASLFFNKQQMQKSVCYFHGSEIDDIVIRPKKFFKLIRFSKKYHKLLCNCKKIICVSDYLRNVVHSAFPNLDSRKLLKVQTGVDFSIYYPEKIDLKEKYNLPKDAKIIFSASRIVERKGYKSMFDIFKRLRLLDSGFYWFIAGTGDFQPALNEMIAEANLQKYVYFLGNLASPELRKYYSSSDVFVLLSHFNEAYGLVYLEALLCGIPVIGNDVGGVGEVIKNAVNGYLVRSDEECFEILKNNSYKNISADAIKNSLQDFSVDKEILLSLCR